MRSTMHPRSMKRHAQGATLVSLMVGLTLSMLVVAAMMLVMRNLAYTTGEARRDAQVDDNLVASLLSAGLTMHEAGFNIKDAKMGNALIVADQAVLQDGTLTGTLATATEFKYVGNLMVWMQDLSGTKQCSGLLAETTGSLLRLTPQNCTDISQWASLNWKTSVVARPTEPKQDPSPFKLKMTVKEKANTCAPFGIAAPTGHLLVTLSASNSNLNQLSASECLGNFIDPTPASP